MKLIILNCICFQNCKETEGSKWYWKTSILNASNKKKKDKKHQKVEKWDLRPDSLTAILKIIPRPHSLILSPAFWTIDGPSWLQSSKYLEITPNEHRSTWGISPARSAQRRSKTPFPPKASIQRSGYGTSAPQNATNHLAALHWVIIKTSFLKYTFIFKIKAVFAFSNLFPLLYHSADKPIRSLPWNIYCKSPRVCPHSAR